MDTTTTVKRAYYPSGALKAEWSYRNGKLDGTSRFYSEKGKLWATETYQNGTRLSVVIEYL